MSERRWLARGAVIALLALLVLPLYWTVISSLTPDRRLLEAPSLVPRDLTLAHYRALFVEREFWRPIGNSLVVAGAERDRQ
jgi:multiple sugar transport system permease protein